MELEDLARWAEAFAAFCAHLDELFMRSVSRLQARKYLRGLVAPLERKTTWQLAELVLDTTPDRMQRLLYRVPWDADAARDRLEQFVSERFGDADGIGVLDETGIPKKGTHSVGVAQQYCGAVGKLANCQVATLLSYASLAQCPRTRLPGPAPVPARDVVPGPGAAGTRPYPRGRALPDQARAGTHDARACLGAGRADALGDGRYRRQRLRRIDTVTPGD